MRKKSGTKSGKKHRLSPRQHALIKARVSGKTLKEAAIAAGYSPKHAASSAFQALKQLNGRVPELMDELGLSERALIEKYLKPLLSAKITKHFQHNGKVKDARHYADNDTRRQSLDMAFRLRGSYAKPDDTTGAPKVLVIDLPRPVRPELPPVEPVVDVPRNGHGTTD